MPGKPISVGQIVLSFNTIMESEVPAILRTREGVGLERRQAA